jgi:hypothetical protein
MSTRKKKLLNPDFRMQTSSFTFASAFASIKKKKKKKGKGLPSRAKRQVKKNHHRPR